MNPSFSIQFTVRSVSGEYVGQAVPGVDAIAADPGETVEVPFVLNPPIEPAGVDAVGNLIEEATLNATKNAVLLKAGSRPGTEVAIVTIIVP